MKGQRATMGTQILLPDDGRCRGDYDKLRPQSLLIGAQSRGHVSDVIRVLTRALQGWGVIASLLGELREGRGLCGWNWAEATTLHYPRVITVLCEWRPWSWAVPSLGRHPWPVHQEDLPRGTQCDLREIRIPREFPQSPKQSWDLL